MIGGSKYEAAFERESGLLGQRIRDREIEIVLTVVTLRPRRLQLITHAQMECQPPVYAPGVLEVHAVIPACDCGRGGNRRAAAGSDAQQQRCDRVSGRS